jgi:hypothetical protein
MLSSVNRAAIKLGLDVPKISGHPMRRRAFENNTHLQESSLRAVNTLYAMCIFEPQSYPAVILRDSLNAMQVEELCSSIVKA